MYTHAQAHVSYIMCLVPEIHKTWITGRVKVVTVTINSIYDVDASVQVHISMFQHRQQAQRQHAQLQISP